MPNVEYGLLRNGDQHAIAVTETTTSSTVRLGKRVAPGFELVIEQAPAAMPATAKLRTGLAFNANDVLYVTSTEPSIKRYSFGIATRLDGAAFITDTLSVPMKEVFHPTIGFCLVDQRGAMFVNGGGITPQSPDFEALLADAGSGAVTTTLAAGVGVATFTRATAAAARLSTGLWKLDVASGTARSHYWEFSPGVMTYGGYLSEPAATQLALLPRDMTNAAWVKGATITVAQDGTGIDGVANSCTRVTAGAVEATNTVLQTLTAAASSRTYSAFIKRVTGTGAVAITQDGVAYTDITAQLNTTSFVQVQLNASQLNASFGIRMTTSTDVILVDCNQFEAGTVATTPIPSAGTRNQDSLSFPYLGNADTAQGSAYAEVATLFSANAPGNTEIVSIGVAGRPIFLGSGQAPTTIRTFDTTTVVSKTGLTNLSTGIRKRASSWGSAGQNVTGDGAAVATGAFDGEMGTTANVQIGSSNGGQAGSVTIMNVRIWKAQAGSAQLQALTA